jgi:histone acetyltransferase 1
LNSINLLSYYYFGLLRFLLVTYLPLVFDTARNPDEAGSANSTSLQPFDLNHFFGEDGKIYGYKNLKINVWISAISFHAYADISFEETSDGGKGITDLKPVLQNIFGENLVEKDEFLKTFSKECEYLSNVVTDGNVIKHDASIDEDSAVEVFHLTCYFLLICDACVL